MGTIHLRQYVAEISYIWRSTRLGKNIVPWGTLRSRLEGMGECWSHGWPGCSTREASGGVSTGAVCSSTPMAMPAFDVVVFFRHLG